MSATEHSVQHLHPTSILFGTLGGLRGSGPFVILAIFWSLIGEGDARTMRMLVTLAVMLLGCLLLLFVYHLVRYLVVLIRYQGDEIVIKRGILFRSERHIPYRRIQNIDLVQNLLHRLFKVAAVKIETSSGGEVEAELRVLSLDAVETMRERVFADRPEKAAALQQQLAEAGALEDGRTEVAAEGTVSETAAAAAPQMRQQVLLLLKPIHLVQVGLITNRGLAIISVVLGLAWQLDAQLNLRERYDLAAWASRQFNRLADLPIVQWVALALGFLLILYTFSICWSFVRFYGFQLERRGDDLRISCGLFTRVGATIPRKRLQFITVRETPLHRLFGKAAVRIETAGTKIEGDDVSLLSRRWFAPLIARNRVNDLLAEVQSEFAFADADWQPLAPKARRRMIRRAVIKMSIIGLAAVVYLPWMWGIASWAVLLALGVSHAWRLYDVTRWAITDRGIVYRTGVVTRRTSVTLFNRVQTVSMNASPLDRRWRMAKLFVDTAGAGTAGHHIRIRDLTAAVASRLRRDITLRAERAGFHWA